MHLDPVGHSGGVDPSPARNASTDVEEFVRDSDHCYAQNDHALVPDSNLMVGTWDVRSHLAFQRGPLSQLE